MREEIGARLLALVTGVTWGDPPRGFLYTSQRMQFPEDAPSQPALYVWVGDEKHAVKSGTMPSIRDLEYRFVAYNDKGKDPSEQRPDTENDLILEAIEERMLATDTPDGRQTLGGLVHHARIEGTIARDSGDTTGQGVLIIPIWVRLP